MESPSSTEPFLLEGHPLPFALPSHFERFYREQMRFVTGTRVRSRDLHQRYIKWASAVGAPAISFVLQRHCMEAIGHRRAQSNGIHYLDAAYAETCPEVADTLVLPLYRRPHIHASRDNRATAALLAKVDTALASLLDLRRAIVAARETAAPHIAAKLALGIFDQ